MTAVDWIKEARFRLKRDFLARDFLLFLRLGMLVNCEDRRLLDKKTSKEKIDYTSPDLML